MRIAVITDGKNISEKFSRVIRFTVFEVLGRQTREKLRINISADDKNEALIYIFKYEGIQVLLCSRIAEDTKMELEKNGIKVVSGLKGNTKNLIRAYMKGYLQET